MSKQSSPSLKSNKPAVKISDSVLQRSSTINLVKTTVSRMGLFSKPSNYFFDTMEKIQLRSPALRIYSETLCYEKLKVSTTQQFFRTDWGGVTAIRYLPGGEKIAVGFNSGDLHICSPMMSPVRSGPSEMILKGWEGNDSISCIRFHPKKSNLLFASSTDGRAFRRDLEESCNYNDFFVEEKGNEIYSIDFTVSCDLVTVGRDATVRLYDVEVEKLKTEFGRYKFSVTSDSMQSFDMDSFHEKRIYCVRCHPTEAPVVVTGGWDGVRVWDTRVGRPMRSVSEPFIFGDTVDLCKSTILTASCQASDTLQLWDLGSGFLMSDVRPSNKRVHLYGEYPYVAQFFRGDPTGDIVLYGVGGLQLISLKESSILYLVEDERPTVAVDSTDKKVAFGGKSNSLMNCKLVFPEGDAQSITLSFASQNTSLKSEESSVDTDMET